MTDRGYTRFAYRLDRQEVDFNALRAIYLTSSYTFNVDHDFVSDLVPASNEISGGQRPDVGGGTTSLDDTNDVASRRFSDIIGQPSGGDTIAAVVVYEFVTNDSDSPLCWYFDSFTDFVADGLWHAITMHADGSYEVSTP